ncbi:IS3 family transposase, partial [Spirosoma utsteinense]|uniref:IS3 family transposase n=1 Tax=Spirosoma utsteinense TaxID=2585773 RepID=UPI001F336F44
LRVHAIFFGWLAAFSQHSDHVATNQTNTPNIIPQHLLSVEDARTEIFEYIEMYYNRVRRHSSLGYKGPEQFESEYYTKHANSVCR